MESNPVTEVHVVGIRNLGLDYDGKQMVEEDEDRPDHYTVYCVHEDGTRVSAGDVESKDKAVAWGRLLAEMYNWVLRSAP